MRRPAAWAASVILAATVITGCGGDGDGDAFCATAEEMADSRDTADMSEAEVQESLDALVDSAPDDVKDDLQVIQDALDDPSSVDMDALDEASNNLDAYTTNECDIDVGG